nr:MAG TPA: major capsid protein [Caudoviricetes sp.]
MSNYDFSGWATRNDLLCGDGRTIRKNAFKNNDGATVPLVWNHEHNDPNAVLGHAVLENRDDGVYAYGVFNDTEQGQTAKKLVQNGDVKSLSIWANKLKQMGNDVIHGNIRELSLVLAGANPGAYVDFVMAHSEDEEDTLYASYDENIMLYHSDEPKKQEESKKEETMTEESKKEGSERTVKEVFNAALNKLSDEEEDAVMAVIGLAVESNENDTDEVEHSEGGEDYMKYNAFDTNEVSQKNVLSHSDQETIIGMAKNKAVGTLQNAIECFTEENDTLAHGIDEIDTLFPEYKDVYPGAPEMITRDQGWVGTVMQKVHKSPISRIRTRQADVRGDDLRAFGYGEKGSMKKMPGNMKLLKRTTDPQTVYRKDALHRDDIIDITDFDVVSYQYEVMKMNLNEELAMAIMIGDGREEGDENKISEDHIRSIWHDDDLYTIHHDVDITTAKSELQGSDTSKHFGDNYVYAEALVTASLYSREKYKGSGTPDLYCTPHLLNVMLLARDLNGRRIYDSKADLAAALNVGNIFTCEQFEGKTRTAGSKTKKLLGLIVNLSDYQVGSTKGGEITKFNQFDIDFNQEKYLIETRLSGALTRVYSAIALEEEVTG